MCEKLNNPDALLILGANTTISSEESHRGSSRESAGDRAREDCAATNCTGAV